MYLSMCLFWKPTEIKYLIEMKPEICSRRNLHTRLTINEFVYEVWEEFHQMLKWS